MKYYNSLTTERLGYDFYCDIAERIVEGRKRKSLRQGDLAKETGLSLSRITALEGVKVRVTPADVEKIAKALDVSPDWLIDALLDCHGKDCLYLVWNERFDKTRFYQEATSARMAFLKCYERISKDVIWFGPRDRAIVKLVGVPVDKAELEAKFPKRASAEDPIEPEEGGTD